MRQLTLDVWSDIACPWCWVGKRRLEGALARFEHREQVVLRFRAFELDPSAPAVQDPSVSYAARLARKYGMSDAKAQGMLEQMASTAAADGLDMRFDRIRPGNTFDAHRLLHLAHACGVQATLKERLFRAYFSEGEAIGERSALARLAGEAGLASADVERVLASDEGAREVRADEAEAAAHGIRGVPFFVFARQLGVSGAQTPEVLLGALAQAWAAAPPAPAEHAEGATCGSDGCC